MFARGYIYSICVNILENMFHGSLGRHAYKAAYAENYAIEVSSIEKEQKVQHGFHILQCNIWTFDGNVRMTFYWHWF